MPLMSVSTMVATDSNHMQTSSHMQMNRIRNIRNSLMMTRTIRIMILAILMITPMMIIRKKIIIASRKRQEQ